MESLLGAPRNFFRGSLGAPGSLLGAFWGPLGASLGHFAANHGLPRRLGHDLECFRGCLRAILGRHGALFGPSWGPVGPSSSSLGLSGGPFRSFLDDFRCLSGGLGRPEDRRTDYPQIIQKQYENRCFFVSRASWGWSSGRLRASGGCWGPLGAFPGLFGHLPDRFGPAGQAWKPRGTICKGVQGASGTLRKGVRKARGGRNSVGGAPSGVPGPVKIYQ